jgi:hypothetical protein
LQAARRGARIVLVSREEADLRRPAPTIRAAGGQASHAVAEVAARLASAGAAEGPTGPDA